MSNKISEIYSKVTNRQCSEDYLKYAIDFIDIKTIYKNQKLSLSFIFNYILNPDYFSSNEDEYITIEDIQIFQPYTLGEMYNYNKKFNI
jgi:hypothetical protein